MNWSANGTLLLTDLGLAGRLGENRQVRLGGSIAAADDVLCLIPVAGDGTVDGGVE